MQIVADIILIFAAFGATFYCFVLAHRLRRFTDLEKGVGGAVAVLATQVDDLTKVTVTAQANAAASVSTLENVCHRSETAAARLELLLASLQDLPPSEHH